MSGSLKEFDKWYKNSGNAWSFQLGATNEAKFQVAWIAALKWVLEQETWIGNDGDGEWGINKYEIEEELNGEVEWEPPKLIENID